MWERILKQGILCYLEGMLSQRREKDFAEMIPSSQARLTVSFPAEFTVV
jgi:hypothetical protein